MEAFTLTGSRLTGKTLFAEFLANEESLPKSLKMNHNPTPMTIGHMVNSATLKKTRVYLVLDTCGRYQEHIKRWMRNVTAVVLFRRSASKHGHNVYMQAYRHVNIDRLRRNLAKIPLITVLDFLPPTKITSAMRAIESEQEHAYCTWSRFARARDRVTLLILCWNWRCDHRDTLPQRQSCDDIARMVDTYLPRVDNLETSAIMLRSLVEGSLH